MKIKYLHLLHIAVLTFFLSIYLKTACSSYGMVGNLPPKIGWIIQKLSNSSTFILCNRLLLYGPPGNGKTTIARAIAKLSNSEFIEMPGPTIVSRYIGQGAKNIRTLFENAIVRSTLSQKRIVIFIDEIDAIACDNETEFRSEHTAALEQLWLELDTYKKNPSLFIIFATNKFDKLHKTFLDRFGGNIVEIQNPDTSMREQVLIHYCKQLDISLPYDTITYIVKQTEGLSVRCLEDLVSDIKIEQEIKDSSTISDKLIAHCLEQTKSKFKANTSEKLSSSWVQHAINASTILAHSSLLLANILTIKKGLLY